ncbi:hypothetical protein NEAUS03_0511 [Nematocida ausubeli]|nr:hypothetical protein NEAUS03_0511 [Nematocida ausubeli]
MEKNSKAGLFSTQMYADLLIGRLEEVMGPIKPEDICKIDRSVSIVIVDPYLRLQSIHAKLVGSTFTHIILPDSKKVDIDMIMPKSRQKRNSIHLDSRIPSQKTETCMIKREEVQSLEKLLAYAYRPEKHLLSVCEMEIEKVQWIFEELHRNGHLSSKEGRTLYLVLMQDDSLLISFPLSRYLSKQKEILKY